MHKNIIKNFKKYYIFWFTWTPIFEKNSNNNNWIKLTTEWIFWEKLHSYTILNAIADNNVLPFKLNFIKTFNDNEINKILLNNKKDNSNNQNININKNKIINNIYEHDNRIKEIVKYIIENFDKYTKRNEYYSIKTKRLKWFNSILTVSSIDMAKKYYLEFQNQLKNINDNKKLKITTIFSYAPNEKLWEILILNDDDETPENINNLDKNSKEFLKKVINNYNQIFKTSFNIDNWENFEN